MTGARGLVILAAVLGAAAGFAGGWLAGSRPPEAPPPPAREEVPFAEKSRAEFARIEEEAGKKAAEHRTVDFPAPPKPADLEARAEAIRRAALERAGNAEAIAAREIAAERAAEERRREEERRRLGDEARGGTMGLLRSLREKWIAPWDLVGSPEAFGEHFRRRTEGPSLDGTLLRTDAPPPEGAVLTFPSGRHGFAVRTLKAWKPFPRDLLVLGQGMDETLLVLDDELDSPAEVDNLTFQDLTIHTASHRLESLRDHPYTLRLVRCRVVGFDTGAAGGDMLSGRVGAFYASDCRFESGYGRSPGRGTLFDVRGVLLARLERCTIRGPLYTPYGNDSSNAVVFSHCRFEEMDPAKRAVIEKPPGTVRLEDCTFDYHAAGETAPARRLADINRSW